MKFPEHLFASGVKRMHKTRRGFTLVEIMIVVIILGMLLAIAAPNYLIVRSRSRARAVLATSLEILMPKIRWPWPRVWTTERR